MKLKGIIFTAISAMLYGVTPILASLTYDMGSTPETMTFYRNLFAVPILLIILLVKKIDVRVSKKTFGSLAVIGVLGCGATTLMLYKSYQYVGVGTASTLHFLYPVFVALICRLFFKEHLGLQKAIALVVACMGTLFFMEHSRPANGLGLVLAIASGLTYAFYMVGMEKRGLKDINPYKVSFYIALLVSTALFLYNIPTHMIVFVLPPKAFLYTFIVSLSTSLVALSLLQMGIKYIGATTAALFCLFEPITSIIAGYLFLGEAIAIQKIVGCLLIIAAVGILLVKKHGNRLDEKTKAM